MPECRQLEPLFTSYVDGEALPQDRATVDAHLAACPPCRARVADERAAREVLRARKSSFNACASEHLRRRCAALKSARAEPATPVPVARAGGFRRRTLVPLSLAATLLLAVGGVVFFGLSGSVEALAAQLALDHVKCFQFPPSDAGRADALELGRAWANARGWALTVPASEPVEQLELLGVRRCASTEGLTAHVMYKWRGQPLSVYVLNTPASSATHVDQFVETVGQEAIVWSERGRTYAVVAQARPAELQHVAQYVRRTAK